MLGLERLTLTEATGPPGGAAADRADRPVGGDGARRRYSRIILRDQRSRWGSCSAKGELSFNWRLVLAPHDVLDYVVVHEVCHLSSTTTGPAFWRSLGRRRRGYREPKEWLDENGWELLAYRPPLAA